MSLDFSPGWCSHCQNTGSIDCYCGGDLCICDNYGEEPCPFCDGGSGFYCDDVEDDFAPKPVDTGDELHQVLGEALAKAKEPR